MPGALRAWFALVVCLGTAVLALAISRLHPSRDEALWLGLLTLLTFASLFRQVRFSSGSLKAVYTMDDVPLFALVFLQGWAAATVAAAASRLLYALVRDGRQLERYVDVPATVLIVAGAGAAYEAVDAGTPIFGGARNLAAMATLALVSHALVFGFKAINQALRSHFRLRATFRIVAGDPSVVRVQILMLVPLAGLLAFLIPRSPLAALLLIVPVSLIHSALQAQFKLRNESERTIQALAHSLEERDRYTQGHSTRVAAYAVEIARTMGLSEADVDQVRRAGLIHDIGKIDIPDAILRKPGQLSPHEREIMRTHTDRAVELGNKLVALRQELPFREAAYHHENYDGSGHYQMAEDRIPLVSRILAVADTFDAMTSDRPYRKGMACAEALERLKSARSTQLDPSVVDAFLVAFEHGAIERAMREASAS